MPVPASDIDFILQESDTAVSVVAGDVSGFGIFDRPDSVIINGYVQTTEYQVLCRTDLFGDLLFGSGIVVDGRQYIVRENRELGDGALVKILLEAFEGDDGEVLPVLRTRIELDGGGPCLS